MFANLSLLGFWLLQAEVSWDLRGMWSQMGFAAKAVVVILFLMSAWSIGVMIDRALMYSAARKQSRLFVTQVAGALKNGIFPKVGPIDTREGQRLAIEGAARRIDLQNRAIQKYLPR